LHEILEFCYVSVARWAQSRVLVRSAAPLFQRAFWLKTQQPTRRPGPRSGRPCVSSTPGLGVLRDRGVR